jgi:protein gp37
MLLHTSEQETQTMEDVRHELFQLIDDTPNLDWLLLTKRPENVQKMWVGGTKTNVWLGTSVENQEWAEERLPYMHEAKRCGMVHTTFISAEPLLGQLILDGRRSFYNHLGESGIDWVITGGESGPNARPSQLAWFRSLRDQCQAAGVAFHFKQWGEWNEQQVRVGKKKAGRLLDGRTHDELPHCAVAV